MLKIYWIIFLLCFGIFSCKEQENILPKTVDENSLNKPEQVLVGIKVSFVDSSYTKAILSADSGFTYSSTKQTVLKQNIVIDFYTKETNSKHSSLTADSVVIEENSKNMTAYGNVKVISDSSFTTLETNLLSWDNKSRKLFTPEFVKITSPREVLQGYGFESDEKLSYYKIFKVRGEQK